MSQRNNTASPVPVPPVPEPADRPRPIGVRWTLSLAGFAFLLSLPLFAPWSWWPLGYVVFVPWLVGMVAARSARWAYIASYLLGAIFFLFHFRWLYDTTPEGYVAASLLYLAPFFPLAAWPIRHLYRQRRIPLVAAFPVVWTAADILRAHNPLGFPWFFLGHSQIRLLPMIQIADITGVYGITFVLAAVNGCIADLLLARCLDPQFRSAALRGRMRVEVAFVLAVVGLNLAYGGYRLSSSSFAPGPNTAVIQGDFLLRAVPNDPLGASEEVKERTYLDLLRQAVATGESQGSPNVELVVLPETPWNMYLNPAMREYLRPRRAHENWVRLTRQTGTAIVVGAISEEPQPAGADAREYRYNSAFLYTPDTEEPQRYDKIHLVPFGEYVPFRHSRRLHWLYRLINDGPWNPWGRPERPGEQPFEYSLEPGKEFTVLRIKKEAAGRSEAAGTEPAGEREWRFGVTICYEDVIPHLFRQFVTGRDGSKRVDFMLNISNDGWFGHGNQQPQHLVNCAFRAVENRVGIARAVNTGVSGFIDPDGRWHDLATPPGEALRAGGLGFRIGRVGVDSRITFYSRFGDVFGFICVVLALVAVGDGLWLRRRNRKR